MTPRTVTGTESAASDAAGNVASLEIKLKRLDNQVDALRVLYLHPPFALRSPMLRH